MGARDAAAAAEEMIWTGLDLGTAASKPTKAGCPKDLLNAIDRLIQEWGAACDESVKACWYVFLRQDSICRQGLPCVQRHQCREQQQHACSRQGQPQVTNECSVLWVVICT